MARVKTFGIMGVLAISLAVFALVAARSGSPEVTDEPPRYIESREKEPVSQVGQGGTARLVFPVSMQPGCLNPYLPGCRGAQNLNGVVFEGPLAASPSGEYRSALAASTPSYGDGSLSLDPMTIELRLRPKAAFSDGEPVTSEDVKWTYEQAAELADERQIASMYSGFESLEEVEVNGPKSVRLLLEEPYAEWRDLLTAPVLPEHVYGDRDFAALPLDEDPVGSGPFLLGGVSESGLSFSASARYWLEELEFPRLDGLEIEYAGPSRAAESLSSENGADFGFFTEADSAPDSGGLLRSEAAVNRTELLVFNSRALDDELRGSVTGSLDRGGVSARAELAATGALFPEAEPPGSGWEEDSRAAAVSPAEPLRLVYPAGGPTRDIAAQAVVDQLSDSNIEVEAERVSPGEFFSDTLPSGDFDLTLLDFGDPAEYEPLTPFLPDNSSLAVSTSLGEMEDQEQYLAQTQRIMDAEDALLPLYSRPDTYAWSSTLSGPAPEASRRAVLWNVREWGFFK